MERVPYRHKAFDRLGLSSFPVVFETEKIIELLEFAKDAPEKLEAIYREIRKNAPFSTRQLIKLSDQSPLNLILSPLSVLNRQPKNSNKPYECFFIVRLIYHQPRLDPKGLLRINDKQNIGLDILRPNLIDYSFASPFVQHDLSKWNSIKRQYWEGNVGLRATYTTQQGEVMPEYHLAAIRRNLLITVKDDEPALLQLGRRLLLPA